LATFNAGAEIGQLLFVAAVLLAIAGLRRFSLRIPGWSRAARGIGTMTALTLKGFHGPVRTHNVLRLKA
jgi:hypothetical protein